MGSGRLVTSVKSWLTDQAYTGGVGDEFKGIGPVTNNQTKLLKPSDRCGPMCVVNTNPWAAQASWKRQSRNIVVRDGCEVGRLPPDDHHRVAGWQCAGGGLGVARRSQGRVHVPAV